MKKHVSLLLAISLLMLAMVGCSSPKMSADQSVLAIYDLYIKGVSEGALELGMTEDEVNTALDTYNSTLINTLRSNMAAAGLTVDDAVLEDIIAARNTAMKAMTATCEVTSTEKDKAVVVLKTTYFDEVAIDEQAANDAVEKASESDTEDPDELLALATEYYTANLVEGYSSAAPSEDVKEITVTCIKSGNVWIPEDMSGFGTELGLVISGQK